MKKMSGCEKKKRQKSITMTPRQKRVGELLTAGKSIGDIAADLNVSYWTARDHVRLLQKFAGYGRVGAVTEAVPQRQPELEIVRMTAETRAEISELVRLAKRLAAKGF